MNPAANPTAFISWAHGGDAWTRTVATFALQLRQHGVVADVDLWHLADQDIDWSTYGPRAIEDNDFILIAVSPDYKVRWEGRNDPRVGAGAVREANTLKSMFNGDQATFRRKVKVVLLPGVSTGAIPNELAAAITRFNVTTMDRAGLEDLLRTLTQQPRLVPNPVGPVPFLPAELLGGDPAAHLTATEEAKALEDKLEAVEAQIESGPSRNARTQKDLADTRWTMVAALGVVQPKLDDDPQADASSGTIERPPWTRIGVVATLLALASLVAAFTIPGGGTRPTVKVGAIYPLIGANAPAATDVLDGVQFAVDYVNSGHLPGLSLPLSTGTGLPNLGHAKLQLVSANLGDPKLVDVRCMVEPAFDRLVVHDHVVAVVGAYESTLTLQAITAANRRRVPLVNEGSTAASLTSGANSSACGAKPNRTPSPWFFRVGTSDVMAADEFFSLIEEVKRGGIPVRRVAILHENNDIFGDDAVNVTRDAARSHGVAAFKSFAFHSTALNPAPTSSPSCAPVDRALVEKLRSDVQGIERWKPDAVFAVGYSPDAIAMVQVMQKLAYTPPALLAYGSGFFGDRFITGVRKGDPKCGLPAADPTGIIARTPWVPGASTTAITIQNAFQQANRSHKAMNSNSAIGFTAMLTLAQAINEARSTDPTKIQAALNGLYVRSDMTIMPWNGIAFKGGQNLLAQVLLQQLVAGTGYVVVYPHPGSAPVARWPLADARR